MIGKLIILDGPNYSGKTTIAHQLEHRLHAVYYREPGSLEINENIRKLIFDAGDNIDKMTQFYLFSACRNELFIKNIQEDLSKGKTVVLDRCFMSTMIYQESIDKTLEVFNDIISRMNCDFNIHLYYITAPDEVLIKRQNSRGITKCFDENVKQTSLKYEMIYQLNEELDFMPAKLNKIINNVSNKSTERIINIFLEEEQEIRNLEKENNE